MSQATVLVTSFLFFAHLSMTIFNVLTRKRNDKLLKECKEVLMESQRLNDEAHELARRYRERTDNEGEEWKRGQDAR